MALCWPFSYFNFTWIKPLFLFLSQSPGLEDSFFKIYRLRNFIECLLCWPLSYFQIIDSFKKLSHLKFQKYTQKKSSEFVLRWRLWKQTNLVLYSCQEENTRKILIHQKFASIREYKNSKFFNNTWIKKFQLSSAIKLPSHLNVYCNRNDLDSV